MQLQPGEQFAIARQIEDPSDTSTYYVRAYIRNARTDALLDTVNLADMGDQRFRKSWQVPADPSGQGTYITITTKVFTDAGYTAVSPDYGIQEHEHLIMDRAKGGSSRGGGGVMQRVTVDYNEISRIIAHHISEINFPTPAKPISTAPLLKAIQGLSREIRAIAIPTPDPVDFQPVLAEIKRIEGTLYGAIDAKPVTPPTDLQPVLDNLNVSHAQELDQAVQNLLEKLREFFDGDLNKIFGAVSELRNAVGHIKFTVSSYPLAPVPHETSDFIDNADQVAQDKQHMENLDRYLGPNPPPLPGPSDQKPENVDQPAADQSTGGPIPQPDSENPAETDSPAEEPEGGGVNG